MQYYIVDDKGNIWGESDSRLFCELMLSNFSEEEIRENGLEIIVNETILP